MGLSLVDLERMEREALRDDAPWSAPVTPPLARFAGRPAHEGWREDWHYEVTGEGRFVCDGRGRVVAVVSGGHGWAECDAIGETLAAAGALVAACRQAGPILARQVAAGDPTPGTAAALDACRRALAAAGQPVAW